MFTVSKEFSFEAAHSLPHLPETHKCHHLHGHSYKIIVTLAGDLDPELSWVMDYADIASAVEPVIKQLDHKNIDEVILIASTAENLAFWIFENLKPNLKKLVSVEVKETESTSVIYRQ